MTLRTTALGSAALAGLLILAAPASAQRSPYTTNPTPTERAQTNALNSAAAHDARDGADEIESTNAANQADYDRARADYENRMDNYAAQRAAYNRDRTRYLNDRDYGRRWNVFYGYNRFRDVSAMPERRLMGLQVSTRGGGFIGRVRDVDTNTYGRVTRIAVSTRGDRVAWIDADDLRYDPTTGQVLTVLSRGQIDDMARMRYPRF